MAKTRPPKKILESYTIKGSDKVIKREAPPLSSAPPLDPEFSGLFFVVFVCEFSVELNQDMCRLALGSRVLEWGVFFFLLRG